MTREKVRDEILKLTNPNILCELPTSFGKTKVALDLMHSRFPVLEYTDSVPPVKILIVVPRLVLIENWKEEFVKWGYEEYLPYVEFVTYMSFPKEAGNWSLIIFDEAHHLSERCREALQDFTVSNSILLSATVSYNMRAALKAAFPDLHVYKVSTKQAINEEILPDPKVYLIPLSLDRTHINYRIIKNPRQKIEIKLSYAEKWKYAGVKNRRIVINCTQRQYYDDMSAMITWYKKKMFNETFKNLFLRKSGERLKWLSDQKLAYIKSLLDHLDNQRTLTFCNGIPQTEELGRYCINSKNKSSEENLRKFNKGEVNHITACNMLDEGMNLVNCRVGVYAVLNSSDRMIKQKLGRLLRHSDPIIIIPYFRGTRDEELVDKMLEDYNPELVTTVTNLTDIKL